MQFSLIEMHSMFAALVLAENYNIQEKHYKRVQSCIDIERKQRMLCGLLYNSLCILTMFLMDKEILDSLHHLWMFNALCDVYVMCFLPDC